MEIASLCIAVAKILKKAFEKLKIDANIEKEIYEAIDNQISKYSNNTGYEFLTCILEDNVIEFFISEVINGIDMEIPVQNAIKRLHKYDSRCVKQFFDELLLIINRVEIQNSKMASLHYKSATIALEDFVTRHNIFDKGVSCENAEYQKGAILDEEFYDLSTNQQLEDLKNCTDDELRQECWSIMVDAFNAGDRLVFNYAAKLIAQHSEEYIFTNIYILLLKSMFFLKQANPKVVEWDVNIRDLAENNYYFKLYLISNEILSILESERSGNVEFKTDIKCAERDLINGLINCFECE